MFGIGCKMRHIGCNYSDQGCHNGIGHNWGCKYGLTWQQGCELTSKDEYFTKVGAVCKTGECRDAAGSSNPQHSENYAIRPKSSERSLHRSLYAIGVIIAVVLSSKALPCPVTSFFINVIGDIILNWAIYALVMGFAVLLLSPAIIQWVFARRSSKDKT